jgi:hypothetical protein
MPAVRPSVVVALLLLMGCGSVAIKNNDAGDAGGDGDTRQAGDAGPRGERDGGPGGSGGSGGAPGTGGTPDVGGVTGSGGTPGAGGATGAGGTPGAGGATGGGGSAGGVPHAATGVVSTGHVLTSKSFRMISTLGSRSATAGTTSSPGARMRSGLVPRTGE